MEPQQQPNPLGHNPYDFILNPPKPATQHPLGGLPIPKIGRHSLLFQVSILVGGAAIVMIVIAVIVSALAGSKINTADLTDLAAQQTELIRVANLGSGIVTQSSNQDLAINTQLTIQTDNSALVSFMATQGMNLSPKQLAADQSAQTTLQLQNAQANSTSDTVFAQVMQSEIQSYMSSLRKDDNEATDRTLKQLLGNDYTQAALLLKQVPTTSSVQN
jgi:hypothetical protein